jgi:acetyl-CoA carboxylase carboxyltransferase component
MKTFSSKVSVQETAFQENYMHHESLCKDLQAQLAQVQLGGGKKYVERHQARGKLYVRDRITQLIDPGTSFLELSAMAGHDLYDSAVPSGGVIAGIGSVSGRQTMVVANDATVKGGTYFPITVK